MDVTATPKSGLDRSQHLLASFSENSASVAENTSSIRSLRLR